MLAAPAPYNKLLVSGVLVVSTIGFWYFSPWVYALPLTMPQHIGMQWLKSWT